MRVTVLGSGSSPGVPMIGCACSVCASLNPKNKRTRVSVLIEVGGTRILVDTSPDLRQQCIANNISNIDAIFYTHAHADHTHGIDDVRSFNFINNAPVKVYIDSENLVSIKNRFSYAFQPPVPEYGWFRPCLDVQIVEAGKSFKLNDVEIIPFEQMHGKGKTLGIRVGDFAYSTDVNGLNGDALKALEGVQVWLVDCLRYEPSPTHAHLDMTLGWIKQVKPRQAFLTHMSHEMEYDRLSAELPEHIRPAYDGLVIEL